MAQYSATPQFWSPLHSPTMQKFFLIDLLKKDNLETVIQILNYLSDRLSSQALQDNLLIQSRRLAEYNYEKNLGIYSPGSVKRERNKITYALNYLIRQLPDKDYDIPENLLERAEETSLPIDVPLKNNLELADTPGVILFLAANPSVVKINFEAEHSLVTVQTQTDGPRRYRVEPVFTVSYTEMSNAINRIKPVIVHFVGHALEGDPEKRKIAELLEIPASDGSGIVLHTEDKRGEQIISTEVLDQLFKRLKRFPQLIGVVLNACHSASQAIAISKHGFWTVGTTDKVSNGASRHFAGAFYHQLARGKKDDFESALAAGIDAAIIMDPTFPDKVYLYHNGKKIIL